MEESYFSPSFTRSAAFVFLAASFNPASPVISEFSVAERRRKKDGLARCTCSFDPHVVHEQ